MDKNRSDLISLNLYVYDASVMQTDHLIIVLVATISVVRHTSVLFADFQDPEDAISRDAGFPTTLLQAGIL